MTRVLRLDALKSAPLKNDPFPYFTVDQIIDENVVNEVIEDFPRITDGGSFNLNDVSVGPHFERFLQALDTIDFRRVLCEKFSVDIMHLPMLVTLRGHSRQKDGKIHTDSKSKVLTVLIYMNKQWDHATGRLRILRNQHDINDYAEEVSAGPGQLIAFKVTDNGWHGYVPFEGHRQSIQINFLVNTGASTKHKFIHALSAKLKALRRKKQSQYLG